MVRRIALVAGLLAAALAAAAPHVASANGRAPAASTITFRSGHETDIAVGLTFGLLLSHDSGATWAWLCEEAVGYNSTGVYDPFYSFTSSGALFATTFTGIRVARDSCTFNATSDTTFASVDVLSSNNILYYAASQGADASKSFPGDFKIYRSTDDGMTFNPTAAQPQATVNYWQSIAVAPSNPLVVYLTGYTFVTDPTSGDTSKQQVLVRTDNGGTSWTALALDTGTVKVMTNSVIDIAGIASDDPTHVYLKVELEDNIVGYGMYRSTNSGATWQSIEHKHGAISAFVVRAAKNSMQNHDLVLGTQSLGSEISHDDGTTWIQLDGSKATLAPHIGCLTENSAGELWACTENYGANGVPSDDAGLMKVTDPEAGTWTKILRYQDLTNAATCAADSLQTTTCVTKWCAACAQLGCTPAASYNCPTTDASVQPPPMMNGGGCCDSGGAGGPGSLCALALALTVGMLLRIPRRRRMT